MMMKAFTTKWFLLAALLLLPAGMQAQRMTSDKAKKAGVVVLLDKYVNPSATQGNVIYLRLKDKSRPDKWKAGVLEEEVCLETKVKSRTLVPIIKPFINTQNSLATNTGDVEPYFAISKLADGLEFSMTDKDGYRKYKIVQVVFYKDMIDAMSGAPSLILGIESEPALAYGYISQMFKIYE